MGAPVVDARELRSHFGYCAPPTPPACVDKATQGRGVTPACEKDMERYVAMVFAYRGCLAHETERAVREANSAIQAVRCAKDPNFCPTPASKSEEAPEGPVERGPAETTAKAGRKKPPPPAKAQPQDQAASRSRHDKPPPVPNTDGHKP